MYGDINWPATIGLNLFRGFASGCVVVTFSEGDPPGGVAATVLMMTLIGPPMLFAIRYAAMRIAMFILTCPDSSD